MKQMVQITFKTEIEMSEGETLEEIKNELENCDEMRVDFTRCSLVELKEVVE